jgi:flagellar hook assembly protein FlgD
VRLLAYGTRPEGKHVVQWDGTNDAGGRVGSGVYYYRLDAGKETFTKKLVVVR